MTDGRALAGSMLAGYQVDRLIGRGGMGRVYRALDTRLERPVALKVLSERLAGDAVFRKRLLRESRLAASLDHPNVIPIYEAGEAEGQLFIAMRFVDGPDLQDVLRRPGPLEARRVAELGGQIAAALDAAHGRGLVHRDVKPSNVLIDEQGGREHCYLADFGLTQSPAAADPADGQLMGTVDYIAPEQIREAKVDGRADQYALACLLFESLTGALPYGHGSDVAVLFAHLEEPVPRASERRRDLPPALDDVLARAMAKEPDERFASCTELAEATSRALGVTAAPLRRRRRWAAPAIAVALVALAAVLALLVPSGGRQAGGAADAASLIRIDPHTNQVSRRVRVPGHLSPLTVTPGGVWAGDFRAGVLWRYDPVSRALQRVSSNGEPLDLAALGSQLYVATEGNAYSGAVVRYDAGTGERVDSIDLLACAIASGDGLVWAAGCPSVQRLTTGPGPLRIRRQVALPFRRPRVAEDSRVSFREMAIGLGSLWVLGDALDRRLWRLDGRSGAIEATIRLPFPPRSVVVAKGKVWVTDGLDDAVVPVDAATGRVLKPIHVGRGAAGLTFGAGSVWVADTLEGAVTRVDPRRRRVVATVRTGGLPVELDAGRGAIWVASDAH